MWQGGLALNEYSVFNLYNANTLTAVGLCSFDPVGPPFGFAIYHNSASATDDESGEAGQGFTLGRGWSTSYSGRLVFNSGSSTTVIEDDGTRNVFILDSGFWTPPTGVHDRLAYDNVTDPNNPVWILTHPSQWKRVFNADGLLIEERDSIGNAVKLVRDSGNNDRITAIRSAAHGLPDGVGTITHQITLGYTGAQLTSITDVLGRVWTFTYRGDNDRLKYMHYPSGDIDPSFMWFEYQGVSGRIRDIHRRRAGSDPNNATEATDVSWNYAYSSGRLAVLTDPFQSSPDPNNPYSTSQQGYSFTDIGNGITTFHREVTDRRGELWKHSFNSSGNRIRITDPLSNESEFAYDTGRNVTAYTNPLEHTWTYTYGPIGNVETVTSPLDTGDPNAPQRWTLDWNPVGDPGATNFFQLTKVTDPAGKWVEYEYFDDDPEEPLSSLVSQVIEMPDGEGNPEAITSLQYYTGSVSEAHAYGHLWRVTDANGVITQFEYDKWGYFAWLTEGLHVSLESGPSCIPVAGGPGGPVGPMPGGSPGGHPGPGNNPNGEPDGGADDNGCPSFLDHDENDNVTGGGCPCYSLMGPDRLGTVGAPYLGATPQGLVSTAYNTVGLPMLVSKSMEGIAGTTQLEVSRTYEIVYDALNRLTSITVGADDPNAPPELLRTVEYTEYDPEDRLLERVGPDGQITSYAYDNAGRLESFQRGGMTAEITYDSAGRVTLVEYGNGAYSVYYYDETDRLESVQHKKGINLLLGITYTWTINNWVSQRVETTPTEIATVDFEYDNRGRLIRETRVVDDGGGPTTTYDIEYAYDQLGNRLARIDHVTEREVEYMYDTDFEPGELPSPYNAYPTHHNRLLEYTIYDTSAEPREALRTVAYTYYKSGQVSNITIEDHWRSGAPGDPNDYDWKHDLALYYWSHGPLRTALWGRWPAEASPPQSYYEPLSAMEFRFDSPRGRYLAVNLNTNNSISPGQWTLAGPLRWTDYDGDEPLGDWTLTETDTGGGNGPWADAMTTRYFGLSGHETLDPNEQPAETAYWHEDLIGSTGLTTDDGGAAAARITYTAFGEVLTTGGIPGGEAPAGSPRYQYAGAYGYESDLLTLQGANTDLPPITLQHLGHRWYQPDIGRFVQRDPIGIVGGINVYLYTAGKPVTNVDPAGLFVSDVITVAGEALDQYTKALVKMTPQSTKPALRPAGPFLTIIGCVEVLPGLTRIYIGAKQRQNAIDGTDDIRDFIDNWPPNGAVGIY